MLVFKLNSIRFRREMFKKQGRVVVQFFWHPLTNYRTSERFFFLLLEGDTRVKLPTSADTQ